MKELRLKHPTTEHPTLFPPSRMGRTYGVAGLGRYFLRLYPGRTALLVGLLLGAGLSEGVGLLTLLPLLQVVLTGVAAEGAAERTVLVLVRGAGAEPTPGVLLVLMVSALWMKGVLRWLAMRQVGNTVARVARDLRVRLMRSLVAARWSHLGTERAGSIATAIGRDAIWSSSAYRHACAALAALIQVVVYAAVIVLVSWRVALLAVAGAAVLVVVLGGFVRMSRRAGAEQTVRARSLTSRLLEVVAGLKAIRGMGRERAHLVRLEREADALEGAERRQVLAVETLNAFQEPLLALLLAPVVYVLIGGAIPFSALLVGVFLVHRLAGRAHYVQSEYQGMVGAEAAFRAVHEQALAAEREREPGWGGRPVPALRSGIRLRGVTARHGSHVVLDSLELEIPARRLTAVVGPSGTGKTTLLDLLLGLETPAAGAVLVDGVPLAEVDRDAWRAGVGYLAQEPALLHDTVAANVALGAESTDRSAIERALREAEVWDRVAALPDGMETVVGERGARLSGGERQRIALARALLLRPRLLVLDEATSELDAGTERAIWRTIAGLMPAITVVAASHRPAVLDVADLVVELRGGRAMATAPAGRAAAGG